MTDFHHLHTGFIHQFVKIFVNGHVSVKCLIKSVLVIIDIRFFNLPISAHYMVDQINCLDSHEPCVFITEFSNVSVLNGFKYLVLEGLVHG